VLRLVLLILGDADLSDADLSDAILDEPICRMDFGGWSIIVIGCKTYPNHEWLEAMADSPIDASEWWRTHGEAIRCVVDKALAKRKNHSRRNDGYIMAMRGLWTDRYGGPLLRQRYKGTA
jgi:hypothetical protein